MFFAVRMFAHRVRPHANKNKHKCSNVGGIIQTLKGYPGQCVTSVKLGDSLGDRLKTKMVKIGQDSMGEVVTHSKNECVSFSVSKCVSSVSLL